MCLILFAASVRNKCSDRRLPLCATQGPWL